MFELEKTEEKKCYSCRFGHHTGKTLLEILDPDMKVACCVINEMALPMFENCLYTVRVSKNSYEGKNVKKQKGRIGPDTTMRLFRQL